jgi:hypothetical protein
MPEKAVEVRPTGYRQVVARCTARGVGGLLKLEEQLRRTVGAFRELGRWFRGRSARTALLKANTKKAFESRRRTAVRVRPERGWKSVPRPYREEAKPPEPPDRGLLDDYYY